VVASTVKNVIARIPGSDSSRAILFDAHFDTRAMTPGASDCSSCVATLLETARALLAGPPLRNDLILVFTDNEEYGGGLGAAALVEPNSWLDEVALVLNFEGLGSTGPSILFETGPDSRRAVQEWARQASHPVGQSWFQEIYGRTPIGTDMNWYSGRGIPGLNFGFWAKGTAYHSMLDTPEALDPRSVQHQGAYALALAQHFGSQDLSAGQRSGGAAIYFSLVRGVLIRYATSWAMPLAAGCGLLLEGLAVVGVRGKQLTVCD
jgi:Zn-dependent M28 family amino/carboxypeptidase